MDATELNPQVPAPVPDLRATARGSAVILQAGRDIITGNVFTGAFARLRDVWLDPGVVFDEVEVEKFAGREWLIEKVDRFIDRHDRGYVVIQAPAGVGKTMVAAWLAATRGWPCHFTRRRKGRFAATALRNLAAQVIAGYQLADLFAPGGVLPETAGEPGWFEQVLKAGGAAAAESGRRLVLIVDGLDEAESFDGDLPLGLPTRLPRGVVMVVTCRTGSRLLGMRLPWERTTFELTDRRNLADMRLFIGRTVGTDEAIAARLAEHGVAETDFVEQLMHRCGGVWVYLRYVLDELRLHLRDPDDLGDLPSDLAGYYTEALRPGEAGGDQARLLATLAAVTEPLPVEVLARLADLPDAATAEEYCTGRLRPFLTAVPGDDGVVRFGIYHVSLRDYLHGATHQPMLDGDRSRADRLARWAREAHVRIADHYTTGFDGYALRNLAFHLERAGRAEDLHGLLAREKDGENVWYRAHDRAGTIADYVSDIQRAHRIVAAHNDTDLAAGRPAARLGLELRYMIMRSGVLSLTTSIPPELVVRLVADGVWSGARALSHAEYLPSDVERVGLLADLLPWLSGELRERARSSVLSIATSAPDATTRGWANLRLIEALGSSAPRHVLAAAVDLVGPFVDRGGTEVGSLFRILSALPEDLLAEVVRRAETMDSPYPRDVVLSEVVPCLAAGRLRDLIGRVARVRDTGWFNFIRACAERDDVELGADLLSLVRSLDDPDDRAIGLAVMAERLPPSDRAVILAEALTDARSTGRDDWRANALHWVASVLPGGADRDAAVQEYLAIQADLFPAHDRVWSRLAVGGLLGEAERRAIVEHCLRLAFRHRSDRVRAWAIDALADAEWADPPFARLLEAARSIADETERAGALEALARTVPDDLREEVMRAVHDLTDADARRGSLEVLAEDATESLAVKLLAEAALLPTAEQRYRLVSVLARNLPAAMLGQALTIVQSITDERGRALLLARIAGFRDGDERARIVAEARADAEKVLFPLYRVRALTRVARVAPPGDRDGIIAEALRPLLDGPPAEIRYYAVKHLFPYLPDSLLARAVDVALRTVRADYFTDPRSFALAEIARWVPGAERDRLMAEAVQEARAGAGAGERAVLLADVAVRTADPELFAEAAAMTADPGMIAELPAGWRRIAPLALRIFSLLPVPARMKAVGRLREFLVPGGEPEPLAEILALVPNSVLSEAVDALGALPYRQTRNRVLGNVALYLPEKSRRAALFHLFGETTDLNGRHDLLGQAHRCWHGGIDVERMEILRRCLDGTALDDCLDLLADGFDLYLAAGGEPVVDGCLDALRAVERWWPRLAEPT